MPRVSVVIATHNRARYVEEAIGSVLKQTYGDYEVIVVNAGSSDRTADLLRAYGTSIRVIETPNDGRSAGRNAGIAAAKGEFVAFLDDDEIWYPRKLERQVAHLDSDATLAMVHAFTDVIDANGVELSAASKLHEQIHRGALRRGYTFTELCRQSVIFTSAVLVRRSVLDAIGGFDGATEASEDWDLWLRVAQRYRVDAVPEVLVRYRYHDRQSGAERLVVGRLNVASKHIALIESKEERASRRARGALEAHVASVNYVAAHRRAFARHAARALMLDPSLAFTSRLAIHVAAAALPRSWWLALRRRRRMRLARKARSIGE